MKSLQWPQKTGCLKNRLMNLWLWTNRTVRLLKAPDRTIIGMGTFWITKAGQAPSWNRSSNMREELIMREFTSLIRIPNSNKSSTFLPTQNETEESCTKRINSRPHLLGRLFAYLPLHQKFRWILHQFSLVALRVKICQKYTSSSGWCWCTSDLTGVKINLLAQDRPATICTRVVCITSG